MTVGFDWEQEDEKRKQRQQTDAYFLELQELKKKRARNAILSTLGVLGLVAVLIVVRQKVGDSALYSDLQQTAVDESRALRSGDDSAFLTVQENTEGWPALQDGVFEDYQRQNVHLVPQGEIAEAAYKDATGHVVMREMLDGKPYLVTWFYHYTHGRWMHTVPQEEYWGAVSHVDGTFVSVDTHALDQAQAEAIQQMMDGWWQTACKATSCGDGGPKPLTVRLEVGVDIQPHFDHTTTLVIPSPHLGRVGEDGSLDPATTRTLARMLGGYWADWAAPAADGAGLDVTWLHGELSTWLAHQFGGQDAAPLLGPLADRDGATAVMALSKKIEGGERVLAALQDVTGEDPAGLPLGWDRYFEAQLRAEAAASDAGAAQFDDPERAAPASMAGYAPESIMVGGVEQAGPISWARVTLKPQPGGKDAPDLIGFEPFRIVDGVWARTTPLPDEFGQMQSQQAGHVILRVSALDAGSVDGLVGDLDSAYSKALSDLGIAEGEIGGLDVTIVPAAQGDDPWLVPTASGFAQADHAATLAMTVASTHLQMRPASQTPREALRGALVREMVIRMVRYRAYTFNARAPLLVGIDRWELARLGVDPEIFLPNTQPYNGDQSSALATLWARSRGGPFVREDAIGADELLGLLVKQKGPEVMAPLLANLAGSGSIENWLKTSAGVAAADIEPQWVVASRATLPNSGN